MAVGPKTAGAKPPSQKRAEELEALAEEFETHVDFAEARGDVAAFEVAISDGIDEAPSDPSK